MVYLMLIGLGRQTHPKNISNLANTAWQTANSPSGKVATMIIPADYVGVKLI